MAKFVQIIEFKTSRIDEIGNLVEKLDAERQASGQGTRPRALMTADRDRPNTYLTIVEFPSYEEAMENSKRPETSEFAARMAELCDGPPKFLNLDVQSEM